MTREMQRDDDDAFFAEANAWFFRLRAEDVSSAEKAEFADWLRRDMRHEHAWQEVLDLMRALKEPARSSFAAAHRTADRRRTSRPRVVLAGIVAASFVAAAIIQGSVFLDRWGADYVTLSGERHAVVLSDGTRVQMNSDTALDLDFENGERRVTVRRGEAFFTVAEDLRPFVVTARDTEIRDIGTAFNVRDDGLAEVVVEEGLVDVSREGAAPVRVGAGQKVEFGRDGVSAVSGADPQALLAWRDGQMVFTQQKLRNVVAELNRYRTGRIVILDSKLADLRVSGTFEIDRPESVPEALRSALGISVQEITPLLVLLH